VGWVDTRMSGWYRGLIREAGGKGETRNGVGEGAGTRARGGE